MIRSLFGDGFLVEAHHPDEDVLLLPNPPYEEQKGEQSYLSYCHHDMDIQRFATIEILREQHVAIEVEHHQIGHEAPQDHLRIEDQIDIALISHKVVG